MINTNDFKTKTIIINRKNVSLDNYYNIALDIGYSGVKGFCPNKVFCFPSYAKEFIGNKIDTDCNIDDIILHDHITDKKWLVGTSAYKMTKIGETNDSNNTLFGRNRYSTPLFHILACTGLGISLMKNGICGVDNRKIVIQTGLPSAYLEDEEGSDKELLINALAKNYDFTIKVGKNESHFKFSISSEIISVMPQPLGTLFSISVNSNGNFVVSKNYFKKNVLLIDAGFGTLDINSIRNGIIDKNYETFDDLSMKEVFMKTTNTIYDKYKTKPTLPIFQKDLETGKVKIIKIDGTRKISKQIEFADILENSNKLVCLDALEKIESLYDSLIDYDCLVITGGTCRAWMSYIQERYKDMETLEIVKGNQNDDLSFVFANVRGYYMYSYNTMKNKA